MQTSQYSDSQVMPTVIEALLKVQRLFDNLHGENDMPAMRKKT